MKSIEDLKKRYLRYIENIEWDTKTNKRKGYEKETNDKRVSDYKGILNDLEFITIPEITYGMIGWECPRCRSIHSPFVYSCACPPTTITSTTLTLTDVFNHEIDK